MGGARGRYRVRLDHLLREPRLEEFLGLGQEAEEIEVRAGRSRLLWHGSRVGSMGAGVSRRRAGLVHGQFRGAVLCAMNPLCIASIAVLGEMVRCIHACHRRKLRW